METGILRHWTLHVLQLNEQDRQTFERQRPYCLPALMTGAVVIDFARRFNPGETLRTNLITGFDLQNMRATTDSGSVYSLQGRGTILSVTQIPQTLDDIACAVTAEILRGKGIIDSNTMDPEQQQVYETEAKKVISAMEIELEEAFDRYAGPEYTQH